VSTASDLEVDDSLIPPSCAGRAPFHPTAQKLRTDLHRLFTPFTTACQCGAFRVFVVFM